MSLWTQLQGLNQEEQQRLYMIYGEHFPIEVRWALAEWIENKPWKELHQDNPYHAIHASNLVKALIQQIQTIANNEQNLVMKLRLNESAQTFTQKYLYNPFLLVRIVIQCLSNERKVIQQSKNNLNNSSLEPMPQMPDPYQEINQKVNELKRLTLQTDEQLRDMQKKQEQFIIQYQEFQIRQQTLQQLMTRLNGQNVESTQKLKKEKQALDNALREKVAFLLQLRLSLIDRYQETLRSHQTLQNQVLDVELVQWKRGQQLSGNDVPFHNNLDQIQEWCEALAEVIWQNKQQITIIEQLCQHLPLDAPPTLMDTIASLKIQITNILSTLVAKTFIIEKQPPQVLITISKFKSTVRLLVGNKLNIHMSPPQVKVTIISEAQASALLINDKMSKTEASCDILNNNRNMEYNSATRQLSVEFANMQLKKIKRKRSTGSVMEEKFALLFHSKFNVGGGEHVFHVKALSLPVVVIVNRCQEVHAWATIMWDNAFAEAGRTTFAVPDKVPFSQVGHVLSQKFESSVGRALSEENLKFLAEKAFRSTDIQDYNNALLSWSAFSKDPLPDRSFTFFEWFYAILKVTRKHLRGLWNDGSVMGFIWKTQAEELLSKTRSETFLLRFSDSELGGVTVAWIEDDHNGRQQINMLQPLTSKDLAISGIADLINGLTYLTYLYPHIPKEQAFLKYCKPPVESKSPPSSKGYVPTALVRIIPGRPGLGSAPNSPQSSVQSPYSLNDSPFSYHDNPLDQSPEAITNYYDMSIVGEEVSVDEVLKDDFMNINLLSGDMNIPVDFPTINVFDIMADIEL